METRFKDSQLAIVDDVLVAEQFAQVWSAMQETRYDSVHASERLSVFRVLDGQPLRGGDFNRFVRPVSEFLPDATDPSLLSELRISPLGNAFDFVADQVLRIGAEFSDLVGSCGSDWVAVGFVPFVYPSGCGLSWHIDDTIYSGSFTYYAQPEWSPFWGGQLLVADPSIRNREKRAFEELRAGTLRQRPHFREAAASGEFPSLGDIGHGHFVHPKPNRLVILRFGAVHMISPVHPAAGSHVRASITGFFFRPEGARKILEKVLTAANTR